MNKLIDGALEFKESDFIEHKELFENLKDRQEPHTLFIGCSDSRIVPNMITKTLPGELFVVRNIANIVPPYRVTGEYVATTSAIEYALNVLKVDNVMICGHSNCGGCASLYLKPHELSNTPHVQKWLEQLNDVKEYIEDKGYTDKDKKLRMTELMNIKKQIKNIFTYPDVKEKVEKGEMNIFGWYYIIGSGDVYAYNFDTDKFELLAENKENQE